MEEWLNIVSNAGFPIAISVYLLTRIEKKLSELSISIARLADAVKVNQK